MGVSMLLLPYDWWFAVALLSGGCGRAKGFGGPCAPALRMALALGEGGGKTTPDEWLASVLAWAGVSPIVPADCRGEDSAVALPPSDCSLGICTVSRGRAAPNRALLVRDGAGISPDFAAVWLRGSTGPPRGRGGGGLGPVGWFRWTLFMSTGWD